jgi:hypothetical protein
MQNSTSDRQMAMDFDNHLKQVMNSLSNEIKKEKQPNNNTNRHLHIIRAKKQLMDILVVKMAEYLREVDSQVSGDIVQELCKQFGNLID